MNRPTPPDPSGCAHCGTSRHDHFQRWAALPIGWHKWVAPSRELYAERYRRARHMGLPTTSVLPTPDGCTHCGEPEQIHGRRWTEAVGLHVYAAPTQAQRLARMRARAAERNTRRTK